MLSRNNSWFNPIGSIIMSDQQIQNASEEATTHSAFSRRSLFALGAGVGAAALFQATSAFAAPGSAQTYGPAPLTFNDIPGAGDIKVLNLALALEDLESDLYAQAIMRLTNGGTTTYGERITGLNVNGPQLRYFRDFGRVENEHAAFLRSTITSAGGTPIAKFRYTFGFGSTSPAPFNANQVLSVVLDAERTGVAAYLAAVPLFAPGSPYLLAANSIQGTEARHTATIFALADILNNLNANIGPVPSGVSQPARNDIDPFGREVTQNPSSPSGSSLLITTPPSPAAFEPQPDTLATPNSILAKVSPFIVRRNAPNVT